MLDEREEAELSNFDPSDGLGADPLAELAKEWAKEEIKAIRAGIEQRMTTPSATRASAPMTAAAPPAGTPAAATFGPAFDAAPAPTRPVPQQAPLPSHGATAQASHERSLPARRSATELIAVTATLVEAGLPDLIVHAIQKDVAREVRPFANDLPVRAQARSALARRIKTKHGWRGKRRTIALVGAPGSGKTLVAAKLCHAYCLGGGLSVGALSLESPRNALRLGMLTEGIGVDFQIAELPSQVPLVSGRLNASDLIVVDTPRADAGDAESLDRLESLLLALRPDETHFLVPASAAIEPSQALLDALAGRIGVDRILITRLDEAPALGAHVALSISSRVPISYLSSGDTVDLGLAPADAIALAGMVLP
jgi:flagellar biosynthesis GTPase FlhF